MKLFYTFILFIVSAQLSAQEQNSTIEEKVENLTDYWYSLYSNNFKEKEFVSKKDSDFILPWDQNFLDKEKLQAYLTGLASHASVKIKKMGDNKILLSSYLPEDEVVDLFDMLEVELIDTALVDQNNHEVVVTGLQTKNWGYQQRCKGRILEEENKLCKLLDVSYAVSQTESRICGGITFKLKFLSGYAYVKVERNNIGDTIKLNQTKLKVIDIIDNKVIVSLQDMELIESLSILNVNDNGQQFRQLDFSEIEKLSKQDKETNKVAGFNHRYTINEYNYQLFSNQPSITLKEYERELYEKLMKVLKSSDRESAYQQEFGEEYVLYSSVDNYENIYFYESNYIDLILEMKL